MVLEKGSRRHLLRPRKSRKNRPPNSPRLEGVPLARKVVRVRRVRSSPLKEGRKPKKNSLHLNSNLQEIRSRKKECLDSLLFPKLLRDLSFLSDRKKVRMKTLEN
jgi:hypothetical protein